MGSIASAGVFVAMLSSVPLAVLSISSLLHKSCQLRQYPHMPPSLPKPMDPKLWGPLNASMQQLGPTKRNDAELMLPNPVDPPGSRWTKERDKERNIGMALQLMQLAQPQMAGLLAPKMAAGAAAAAEPALAKAAFSERPPISGTDFGPGRLTKLSSPVDFPPSAVSDSLPVPSLAGDSSFSSIRPADLMYDGRPPIASASPRPSSGSLAPIRAEDLMYQPPGPKTFSGRAPSLLPPPSTPQPLPSPAGVSPDMASSPGFMQRTFGVGFKEGLPDILRGARDAGLGALGAGAAGGALAELVRRHDASSAPQVAPIAQPHARPLPQAIPLDPTILRPDHLEPPPAPKKGDWKKLKSGASVRYSGE